MTSSSSEPRAWSSLACWVVLLSIITVGLVADLTSKSWAFETVAGTPVTVSRHALLDNSGYNPIPPHEGVVAIPGRLLNFHLVLNSGAVFGIGSDQRVFFICFTLIAVSVALYIFGWQTDRRSRLAHVGIALVLAGALGNLWDRLLIGRVRDFLHMFPGRELPFGLNWPGGGTEIFPWVFNVADVLLLTGMAVLLIHLHLSDRRIRREAIAAKQQSSSTPPPPAE
ncbi:MAG: signal peptidase II [Phycisphaerales bacterium]|nr:signal peptidase II [Phycisphaerales bacterium]